MKHICIVCNSTNFTDLIHFESLPIILGPLSKKNIGKVKSYPFSMSFCNYCNHVQQLNPIPKNISDKIYSDDYYSLTSAIENEVDLFTVQNFYNFFKSCNSSNGNILEIGCFDGNLLLKLFEDGLDIFGIDPSNATKELLNRLGSKRVKNEFLTPNSFGDEKFGTIIFRNLLEHLHSPKEFLEIVRNKLNDNGAIFIDVPNFKAMVDTGGFGDYIHEHISSFTIESIDLLLGRMGFEIKKFIEHDYLYVYAKKSEKNKKLKELKNSAKENKALREKAITQYNKVKNNFLNFFDSKNYNSIGIFGASARTNALINVLSDDQLSKIKFIFDNDIGKLNKYLDGCNTRISVFDNSKIVDLDIILISTYLFEKEILSQLKSSKYKNIKVATFHPEVVIHQL